MFVYIFRRVLHAPGLGGDRSLEKKPLGRGPKMRFLSNDFCNVRHIPTESYTHGTQFHISSAKK